MAGRKTKERAEGLRALSDEKLAEELHESYRRLFTVRLQLSTRQLQKLPSVLELLALPKEAKAEGQG